MSYSSIQERFHAHAVRAPGRVAVSTASRALTFGQLDERSDRIAARLRALGVGRDDPVALLMDKDVDLVAAMLGVLKAGACYLPLHTEYPLERLQWVVGHAGPRVLLTDAAHAEPHLTGFAHHLVVDDGVERWPSSGEPGAATPGPASGTGPADLAVVIYTSGSTGKPKGVGITHGGLLDLVADSLWDSGFHDRVLSLAPHAFGVSAYEFWVPLLRGGSVALAPGGPADLGVLRELLSRTGATGLHLTAGLFRVVADQAPEVLHGVREVLTGGDVVSAGAVRRVMAACPDTRVRVTYGATELSSFAVTCLLTSPAEVGSAVPIGVPMDGVTVRVLDERSRPVEGDRPGELFVGGPRVARGYLDDPELTARSFGPDPADPAGRLYRTRDVVRWNERGQLEFVSRAGGQLKIRGYLVEPAEVEATLGQLDGVRDVVVSAGADGGGEPYLVAHVVSDDPAVDARAVIEHARWRLPEYMVPGAVVVLDRLPLTPNGKLDREALPAPGARVAADPVEPATSRQQTLCRLFAEVLGVERVGLTDNFFDLNGQSLLGVKLAGLVESTLGTRVNVADVFNAPTPAELDALLGPGVPGPAR